MTISALNLQFNSRYAVIPTASGRKNLNNSQNVSFASKFSSTHQMAIKNSQIKKKY